MNVDTNRRYRLILAERLRVFSESLDNKASETGPLFRDLIWEMEPCWHGPISRIWGWGPAKREARPSEPSHQVLGGSYRS